MSGDDGDDVENVVIDATLCYALPLFIHIKSRIIQVDLKDKKKNNQISNFSFYYEVIVKCWALFEGRWWRCGFRHLEGKISSVQFWQPNGCGVKIKLRLHGRKIRV